MFERFTMPSRCSSNRITDKKNHKKNKPVIFGVSVQNINKKKNLFYFLWEKYIELDYPRDQHGNVSRLPVLVQDSNWLKNVFKLNEFLPFFIFFFSDHCGCPRNIVVFFSIIISVLPPKPIVKAFEFILRKRRFARQSLVRKTDATKVTATT